MTPPPTIHGTVVAWGERAVLLRGPPGSGKSDLALRLIALGCQLVADDRVVVAAADGVARAGPPPALAGLIEARGVGILALPFVTGRALALVVDLVEPGAVPRMPEPILAEIAGVYLPCLSLAAFEASTPLKIVHVLAGRGPVDRAVADVADGIVAQNGCK